MSLKPKKFVTPLRRRNLIEDSNRRVTWAELFYDLVFVVVISTLSHMLYRHPTLVTLLIFAYLFVAVWYAWVANTFYADRFDTDDPFHRFLLILQMLFLIGIAASLAHSWPDRAHFFILFYVLLRLTIVVQYSRVYIELPDSREITKAIILVHGGVILLWGVSFFVRGMIAPMMWLFAILLDISMPYILRKRLSLKSAKVSSQHLSERFGLFIMVILGETVAGLVSGIIHTQLTFVSFSIAFVGLLIIFSVWWLYYDNEDETVMQKSFSLRLLWEYAHLPFILALTIMGVSLQHLFTLSRVEPHFEMNMLFISYAIILGMLILLNFVCYHGNKIKGKVYLKLIKVRMLCFILTLVALIAIPLMTPLIGVGIILILACYQIIDNIKQVKQEKS